MRWLTKGFNWLAAGILVWAALLAALQPVHFFADQDWVQPAVMLSLVGGILLIANGLKRWQAQWSKLTYQHVVVGLIGLVVVTQLIIATQFVDVSRADAYFVRNQAILLAQGHRHWATYFLVYPNNVNFTLVESLFIKLSLMCGWQTPWMGLNLLRFAWLDTGLAAILVIIHRWHYWRPSAIGVLLIWWLSVPIYAFGLFAYTDALVMPLPVVTVALAACAYQQSGWRRWGLGWLMLLLVGLGVAMKSNMIVLWLALCLSLLIVVWRHQIHWGWLLNAVLALGLVLVAMQLWAHQSGYRKATNTALPTTSWIAMSLKPTLSGQYNDADVQQIRQQKTAQQKKHQAQKMIKQRVKQLGASGLLTHLFAKFRVFWATGDCDSFKLTTQWLKAPPWYIRAQRTWQFWLVTVTQAGFISLLFGSVLTLIKSRRQQFDIGVFALMLIGLTVFHVGLWEVEARYALPLLPILMLLGVTGWALMPVYRVQRRWLASGLAVWLAAFSWFSVAQTSLQVHQTATTVARQGNGSYFQPTDLQIQPGQWRAFTITTIGTNDQLQLKPLSHAGQVHVMIQAQGQLLRQVTGSPEQVATISYPQTEQHRLHIQVQNCGSTPVTYAAARATYLQSTGRIVSRPQTSWQYYVVDQHATQSLTTGPTISLVLASWLGLSLLAIWYRPTP